jgi:hypothetical protein
MCVVGGHYLRQREKGSLVFGKKKTQKKEQFSSLSFVMVVGERKVSQRNCVAQKVFLLVFFKP